VPCVSTAPSEDELVREHPPGGRRARWRAAVPCVPPSRRCAASPTHTPPPPPPQLPAAVRVPLRRHPHTRCIRRHWSCGVWAGGRPPRCSVSTRTQQGLVCAACAWALPRTDTDQHVSRAPSSADKHLLTALWLKHIRVGVRGSGAAYRGERAATTRTATRPQRR
jgi:hypothetical protein